MANGNLTVMRVRAIGCSSITDPKSCPLPAINRYSICEQGTVEL